MQKRRWAAGTVTWRPSRQGVPPTDSRPRVGGVHNPEMPASTDQQAPRKASSLWPKALIKCSPAGWNPLYSRWNLKKDTPSPTPTQHCSHRDGRQSPVTIPALCWPGGPPPQWGRAVETEGEPCDHPCFPLAQWDCGQTLGWTLSTILSHTNMSRGAAPTPYPPHCTHCGGVPITISALH